MDNKNKEYPYSCSFDQTRETYSSDGEGWGIYVQSSWSNRFIGLSKAESYPDVTSIHDFKPGEKAFLVWIEYSTGDSFGSHTREQVLPIALFKSLDDAKALRDLSSFWYPVKDHDSKKYQEYEGSFFESSDGQIVHFTYAPWTGYFENLEEIHIEEVTIWE